MNKMKIWIAKQYAKAIERYEKKLADIMCNMTFDELAQFGEEMKYTKIPKSSLGKIGKEKAKLANRHDLLR